MFIHLDPKSPKQNMRKRTDMLVTLGSLCIVLSMQKKTTIERCQHLASPSVDVFFDSICSEYYGKIYEMNTVDIYI